MKKIIALLTLICVMATGTIGTVSASAESATLYMPSTVLVEGITPFASPVISSINYSIKSINSWVTISLNQTYSGTAKIIIQKKNGSSWDNHTTICSNDSFSGTSIYKTNSSSLEASTYRIAITVTISGVSYTSETGSVTIS